MIANLTADGCDRSLDDKRSGLGFAPGSWEAQVIAPLAPLADELVVAGLVTSLITDQCIDHTAQDAADCRYTVTGLIDACMAESAMGGCARWRS